MAIRVYNVEIFEGNDWKVFQTFTSQTRKMMIAAFKARPNQKFRVNGANKNTFWGWQAQYHGDINLILDACYNASNGVS